VLIHVQSAAGESREKDESSGTGPGPAAAAISHAGAITLGRSGSSVAASMSSSATTGDFMSEMTHRLKERRAKAVCVFFCLLPVINFCHYRASEKVFVSPLRCINFHRIALSCIILFQLAV